MCLHFDKVIRKLKGIYLSISSIKQKILEKIIYLFEWKRFFESRCELSEERFCKDIFRTWPLFAVDFEHFFDEVSDVSRKMRFDDDFFSFEFVANFFQVFGVEGWSA